MAPLLIGTILGGVGKIADDLVTTDKERLELALKGRELDLQEREIDQRTDIAQIGVNVEEAKSTNWFVSGARPAILWVGASAMLWTFLVHPMLMWLWQILQAYGKIPVGINPPPTLANDDLWVIVSGVLGIGGMRSFEKVKNVATKY